jgi:hypothetical protein
MNCREITDEERPTNGVVNPRIVKAVELGNAQKEPRMSRMAADIHG